jgi:hypothetical protein
VEAINLNNLLGAQLGQVAVAFTGELQLGFRRQADSVQQMSNIITAVAAGELLRSDDPMQLAGLNAGANRPVLDRAEVIGAK